MKFWGGSFVANPFGSLLYKGSHEEEEIAVVEIDTAETDRCTIGHYARPQDQFLSTDHQALYRRRIKYPIGDHNMKEMSTPTPKDLGYYFPAEFDRHRATWLSWPHKEASWPGKIQAIYPHYSRFIAIVAEGEKVCINVNDQAMKAFAENCLKEAGADMGQINFYFHPTNDAWCRDHGPAFLVNPRAEQKKLIVDWGYNAWGDKYPPYDLDDVIPTRVGEALGIPVVPPRNRHGGRIGGIQWEGYHRSHRPAVC